MYRVEETQKICVDLIGELAGGYAGKVSHGHVRASSVDESVNRFVASDEELDQFHAGLGVLKVQLMRFGFSAKFVDEISWVRVLECESHLYLVGNEVANYGRTDPPGASRY